VRLISLLAFLLGLGLLTLPATAQNYSWASPVTKASGKSAVATSKDGVSYVLTSFTGTITIANRTITSLGSTDLLLVCYNAAGKASWARRIGSSGEDLVGDVALHPVNGFVFVTGTFQSTVKFEDVSGNISMQLTSAGGSDAFVAQFHNQSGYVIWARQIGGAGTEKGNGIDLDQAGNAYLTGSFTGTTKVTGGNASFALTSSGQSDIYLAKYNDEGTALMARRLGGAGFDFGAAVAVSPINGDIYLTGGLSPSSNLYITNAFVAKLDAAGTLQWNKPSGSPANVDAGTDITATNFGAYATGYFAGSVLFGNTTLTSSGSSDAFVVFYPSNAAANNTKAYKYGGGGWDEGQCIDNYNGDVYVGGTFTGKATLINGTFTALGGAADRDMFISRLPWGGSPGWTRRIGSTGFDYGNGGVSAPLIHAIFFTGHHGAPATLGNITLSGSGGLITRIDLPFITDFKMVNATTDADIRTIKYKSEFNYQLLGTDKLNIRANTLNNSVGSIKFTLDGVTVKIENGTPPFTYAGDAPKAGGGTDYFGFTPTVGEHTLQAIAYSGPNATGEQAVPVSVTFSISNKPILAGLTLIDAFTDGDIKPLAGGETINCSVVNTTEFSIRANTNPGVVGSVKFVLNGVERIENTWPYAVAGDQPKPGGVDYLPMPSNISSYKVTVTAYSGPNATGEASTPLEISFSMTKGDAYRKAAAKPGPETQPATFLVAPNPFAGRTSLSFTAGADGPAVVEVYNAQGVRVARLFEGTLEKAKAYAWSFDGSAQPSGLYFARIKAGQQVYNRRLVLNK
jgi:hypothetical protein